MQRHGTQMTKLSLLADVPDDECRLLLQQIAELIATAKRPDLPDSVHLLNMAYLDLQTKIYDINDEELAAFSRIIRSSTEPPGRSLRCPSSALTRMAPIISALKGGDDETLPAWRAAPDRGRHADDADPQGNQTRTGAAAAGAGGAAGASDGLVAGRKLQAAYSVPAMATAICTSACFNLELGRRV